MVVLRKGSDGSGAVVDRMTLASVVDGGRTMVRWVRHRRMQAGKAGGIGVAFVRGEAEAVLVRDGADGVAAAAERVGVPFSPPRRPRLHGRKQVQG